MSDLIDNIIKREGGDKVTNKPNDRGGRTQYGISEKANPEAWADGIVTNEEARAIFEQKYIKTPGFDKIKDPALFAQLVDFGVNSGPSLAIQKLQAILHVKIDGVLGPKTLVAIELENPIYLNNKLAVARVQMIGRIVQKNPSQLEYLSGWLNRALEFLV